LGGFLYSYINDFLTTFQIEASYFVLSISKFLMIRIAEIHLDTNGNAYSFRRVHLIIMSSLIPIIVEMLFAVRFASQRDSDY
jgi:hypothetical protein